MDSNFICRYLIIKKHHFQIGTFIFLNYFILASKMFIIIHSYSKTRNLYFLIFNHIHIFVTLFLCLSGIYYACVMSKLHRFTCHVTRKVFCNLHKFLSPFCPLKRANLCRTQGGLEEEGRRKE